MPTEITIVKHEIRNEYTNGIAFTDNPTDFALNLVGNVMEKVKITTKIQLGVNSVANSTTTFSVDNVGAPAPATNIIIRSTGSFLEDGFSPGDNAALRANWSSDKYGAAEVRFHIDNISTDGSQMYVTTSAGSFLSATYNDAGIWLQSAQTALIYKFGLIENNEPFNAISKVSGNEQAYYLGGITGSSQLMNISGSYEDWVTGASSVRYFGTVAAYGNYIYEYELIHNFIIVPFYLAGQLSNLQNNVLPSLFDGLNSLKYAFEMDFRSVLSNPNTSKIGRVDNILGSVGWFNEAFNGFANNYAIVSIDYEDFLTSESADGLLIGDKTKVAIEIEKLSGTFGGAQKVGIYLAYLPEQSEYQDTTTDLPDNFLYSRIFCSVGGGVTGATGIFKSAEVAFSGSNLVIEVTTEYDSDEQARLSGDKYYILAIQVADEALSAANSDRVMLIADVNQYDESADIPGLMVVEKFDIYQHDIDVGVDVGYTDWTGWNEDNIVIDFEFYLDLAKEAYINTLSFILTAFNTVTEEQFDLNSFSFAIAGAIVSNDVQQLEIDTTRGYKLASNSQFNFVKITTGARVGDLQYYTGQIGQKISWQDWIAQLDADPVFYDNSEPLNNLNKKSSNYSELNNYEIRLALMANVYGVSNLGQSGNTDYQFLTPNIKIYDYDLPAAWTAEIKTYRYSNMTDLAGAILTGEATLFRIIWTKVSGAVTDITGFWAIHRIEETGDSGYNIQEISTIRDFPADNLLQPITAQTQLYMYLGTGAELGKVITECLINGEGDNYNISGRLSDGIPPPIPLDDAKETEASETKTTEDDQIKTIDE